MTKIPKGVTHGMSRTRLYHIWQAMKNRCYYEKNRVFSSYGGRGITVCKEWIEPKSGFVNFCSWALKNGYADNLSIDRIDNDGNYEPSNCRWADRKTQDRNKKNSRFITYAGETLQLCDFADKYGVSKKIASNRFDHGWSAERIINTPYMKKKIVMVNYKGKEVTFKDLSEITGIRVNTLRERYYKGLTIEEVTSKERLPRKKREEK